MQIRAVLALSTCLIIIQLAEAAASGDALDEIVVTAQRRSERLQDVPEAITALSGDALNQLHLQGTADLAGKVPSLSFQVLGPGESSLAIRGLGTSYGLAPAVSYYVNETPLDIRTDGFAGAPDIDFFDVERIEVLRGPQGTLYGSSSMGGALRILTAQPDSKAFAVSAEVGGSSTEGGGAGYVAKSAVNLPLSDDAAVRLVGAYEHVPGYINRATPGDFGETQPNAPVTARRTNDADIKSGRIIGLWKATDALTITPSVMISQIEASNNSNYFSNLPSFTTAGYYATPQQSHLTVGNMLVDYDFGFATLMSSTSVLTRNVNSVQLRSVGDRPTGRGLCGFDLQNTAPPRHHPGRALLPVARQPGEHPIRRAGRTQPASGACQGQRQQSAAGAELPPDRGHDRVCHGR